MVLAVPNEVKHVVNHLTRKCAAGLTKAPATNPENIATIE